MRVMATVVPVLLAAGLGLPAVAQTLLDIGSLREIDDAEVLSADGREVGEIEEILVDRNGTPVAVTVEIEGDFLEIGAEEVVFSFDQLSFEDGDYVTALTEAEIEQLPRFED